MAKPVVSSTFLSFPKLLLWSLPLLLILIYTYLGAGLDLKLSSLVSLISTAEEDIASTAPIHHDSSFSPHHTLRVTEQPFTASCIAKDKVILINGTSPGPELRLVEGNIYWIRVYNDMDKNNLTMHWHGLSMATSPFSDGTPGASQWPIPPNHYFDYELEITPGNAGTYFYHSHIGFQAVTAAGPLIVEEAGKPPYEYDDERIIALSDVFEKSNADIEEGLVSNPFQWSGETANILVNGQGQLPGSAPSDGCKLATINVEPDTTYRFRFIGGTALSFVTLAFEDHDEMTLIEADGGYVKPIQISHLQIGSGQRFSVLFKTKSRSALAKDHFYLQMETRDRPTLTRSY
ncbi:Multicopper oxidase aurL2, partial [Lachnellula suecica]